MMITERCRAVAVMRLYQNKRHCFKERWQYYLRVSCLFFYGWHTDWNFFVIYMYNVSIQLTVYTQCTTHTMRNNRGSRGGPPPPRFVKGKVLCRGLIGRRGGPTVLFTLLLSFFLFYKHITRTHTSEFNALIVWNGHPFSIFPLSKLWNRSNLLSLALW